MLIEWRNQVVGNTIKAVTWNNYVRHLKALYNFAIAQGLLCMSSNPFNHLFIRESRRKKKTYSSEQLHKIDYILHNNIILPSFLKPSWFILAIIMTLRCTGIRRGQLVKLKIGDVNLSNRTIYISPEINKNHDYHIVPISDSLYPHIERLIQELKIHKQTDDCQLFNLNLFSRYTRRKGQPMSQNQLTHIFRHISDLVGFTSSPHRFRHTVATQLMKKPENVYVVKKLLGHKDISVTLGY
ncbi:TPA: site-specific integrase, partial [Mannheimia haemolytica]|nr:site-specific integrase [Mannheimia haemolytica]